MTLAGAIDVIRGGLVAGHDLPDGCPPLIAAARAIATVQGDDQGFSSHVILAQLRSAAVDLLQASGLSLEQAQRVLHHEPPVSP